MFDRTIVVPINLLPGRLRVSVKGLRFNVPLAARMRGHLCDMAGIHAVHANYRTGNLTVVFDETVISPAKVLAPTYRLAALELRQVGAVSPLDAEVNPHGQAVMTYGSLAVASGGVLAYVAVRRATTSAALVANSPMLMGLATATTLISGYPLLQKGIGTLASGKRLSPELILTITSIVLSLLRSNFLGLSVLFLVHVSNLLQALVDAYAHMQLTHQLPVYDANYQVECDGGPQFVPLQSIKPGDTLCLAPGQIVPVDGRVLTGIAVVNELSHAGEVDTVVKSAGSAVWAGTRLEEGKLKVLVLRVGQDTVLSQMLHGFDRQRSLKGQESAATAATTLGNFALLGSGLALALGRPRVALAVLLAGNPAPLQHAHMLALGSISQVACRQGIMIRRANRLTALTKANAILFDKTGTLTEGRASVVDVIPINRRYNERELLILAASAEQGSGHQFAEALLLHAQKQRLPLRKVTSQSFAGNGIAAEVSNTRLLFGNETFMKEHAIDLTKSHEAVRSLRLAGASAVYLANKNKLIGVIAFKDKLKDESHEAIEALRVLGFDHIGIVTGDSLLQGEQAGVALGVNDVWSEQTPHDKMRLVETLKQQGYTVTVVGDGHNDLLAMGAADVSIALKPPMGSEAMRVADIVILDGDPRKVALAVYLAQHHEELRGQNSIVATAVNLLGVGLALLSRTSLSTAALLPSLSSLAIVANSLRFKKARSMASRGHAEVCATLSAPWHALLSEQVIELCNSSSLDGLTTEEANRRLMAWGENVLVEQKRPSAWRIFLGQLNDFMVRVLLGASLLSLAIGHPRSAVITTGVVLFNAVIGVWQELQNGRAAEELLRLTAPIATVQREGTIGRIISRAVVPGDILLLEAGDKVAADARIISAQNLELDESSLTGESLPVCKRAQVLHAKVPVADRNNMLYMGTVITRGRGKAVVVSTGTGTEMGQISALMNSNFESETPLKRSLEELARYITYGCLAVSGFIVGVGMLRGQTLLEMLLLGTSLAVAAIPEGLASAVTIALFIGVQRMLKRGILIRKLPALETLGCTTVICSDKTGTLTTNEMTVRRVFAGGTNYTVTGEGYKIVGHFERDDRIPLVPESDPALMEALRVALHCNNASYHGNPKKGNEQLVHGDPTERALLVAALKAGLRPEREQYERLLEMPFESLSRRMNVVCRTPAGRHVSYCKGAVEEVLSSSTQIYTGAGPRSITAADREQIMSENKKMASQAMRVLALAVKYIHSSPSREFGECDADMTFVGLVAMSDPPRAEVKAALAKCRQAGVRVVMITGDQPLTAQTIAAELGILTDPERLITGLVVDSLSDDQLSKCVERIQVFARTTPHHKLRIVNALRQRGQVVAMTGDGVNDAPSLKAAHVGIAMGSGTEVSKEAAGMVINDDNFATIVTGIEEGRAVFSNFRKAMRYLLATNAGEVVAMAAATLLRMPAPLTALQLLWVNLLGDGLPAIALMNDPPSKHAMQGPPRKAGAGVLSHGLGRKIVQRGLILGLTSLWAFRWKLAEGGSLLLARTFTLATVSLSQFVHLFDIRSDSQLGRVGVFSNRWLIYAVLTSLALLGAQIQLPCLQGLIGTTKLGMGDWLLAGSVAGFAALADNVVNRTVEAPCIKTS